MAWKNPDGVTVRFGAEQGARGARSGVTTGAGKRRELVLFVDLVALGAGGTSFTEDLNNDGVNEAFADTDGSGLNTPLPAGTVILSQKVVNIVTPAGGTSYAVGTYQASGTVDTANGIRIAAGTDGAQVGTQLAAARYVGVNVVGTYTAGKIKVIVEYMTQ
jgi:hypothetical protein